MDYEEVGGAKEEVGWSEEEGGVRWRWEGVKR